MRTSARAQLAAILAVDDEPDALEVLRMLLSEEGFAVDVASSGAEALRCADRRRPDLVITDYKMRGADGLALSRHLRERSDTCEVPILLLTGADPPPQSTLCDRIVTKPADFEEILVEVRALLARRH